MAAGVFGDAVYAIPQASGPMGFFYRQDLFDKWGIEPPKTWKEFRQAAQTIREHGAYIWTFPPGNSAWFTALAWQAGAKWFGVDGDTWTVNIDNPETRKVAEYWDDMVKKTGQDRTGLRQRLVQGPADGAIVAWVSAQWGDGILPATHPRPAGKWGVAPMPQWDGVEFTSANWGGSSTAVLKGAEYPKEAMEFAVWLNTDPESIDLLIEGGYGWPAAKDALAGSALDKPYAFFGGQKINEVFAEADKASTRTGGGSRRWPPPTSTSTTASRRRSPARAPSSPRSRRPGADRRGPQGQGSEGPRRLNAWAGADVRTAPAGLHRPTRDPW